VQVVYIDTLFILNLAINYLLLLGTGHFSGFPFKRPRLLLSAIFGALYAVLVYIPDLGFLASAAGKVLSGIVMVFIGFGFYSMKRFARIVILFFLVSVVFGGGVMAIYIASGGAFMSFSNGILYSRISLKVLIISIALCYGLVSIFFGGVGRHGAFTREAVKVRVSNAGKEIAFTALVDSGNTLRDPVTNSPVLIAETETVIGVLPLKVRGLFDAKTVSEPAELMEILSGTEYAVRFRLIPFRTVGTESGLLIAFRPDSVEIAGKLKKGMLIALSSHELSEGAGYCALVGALN
jgi:stage II sporulation protein GA (sporulation sigma-E factor processing peptidase)